MRRFFDTFHRDRDGAVLFLMLAAVMILMLMAWMIVDATMGANHKVEAQASADVAALSHSSVKARSMNMMAYANVSKRSVFLAHATYIAHFLAFAQWSQLIEGVGRTLCCVSNGELDFACTMGDVGYASIKMWEIEAGMDFASFAGGDVDFSVTADEDGNITGGVGEHQDYLNHSYPLCTETAGQGLILGTDHFQGVIDAAVGGFFEIVFGIIEQVASGGNVGDYVKSEVARVLDEVAQQLDGILFSLDDLRPIADWSGLTRNYYAEDLKALDNYQRYLAGATPWWAWSESLTRALRNGATTSGTSPRPPGMGISTETLATNLSGALGMDVRLDNSGYTDVLPVRPGIGPRSTWSANGKPEGEHDVDYMYKAIPAETSFLQSSLAENLITNVIGIGGTPDTEFVNDPLFYEHMTNLLLSALGSTYIEGDLIASAALGILITARTHNLLIGKGAFGGDTTFTGVERTGTLEFTQEIFEDQLGAFTVNPWLVNRYKDEAKWLASTSNITFTYAYPRGAADPHQQRQKYDIVETDGGPGTGLGFVGQIVSDTIYKTTGYWAMARSEISYQGIGDDQPSLWEPVWTARLRPVALPGEAPYTTYSMSGAYHDALSTMALARLVNMTDFQMVGQALIDFLHMERSTRAMGESTVEGVAK